MGIKLGEGALTILMETDLGLLTLRFQERALKKMEMDIFFF